MEGRAGDLFGNNKWAVDRYNKLCIAGWKYCPLFQIASFVHLCGQQTVFAAKC